MLESEAKISRKKLKLAHGKRLSSYQQQELMKSFQQNQYITGQAKKLLAEKTSLTENTIKQWFFHQRKKKQEELGTNKQQSSKQCAFAYCSSW